MKGKKLNLGDLSVKSFTTANPTAINGGNPLSIGKHCSHVFRGCSSEEHTRAIYCSPDDFQ